MDSEGVGRGLLGCSGALRTSAGASVALAAKGGLVVQRVLSCMHGQMQEARRPVPLA